MPLIFRKTFSEIGHKLNTQIKAISKCPKHKSYWLELDIHDKYTWIVSSIWKFKNPPKLIIGQNKTKITSNAKFPGFDDMKSSNISILSQWGPLSESIVYSCFKLMTNSIDKNIRLFWT